MWHPARVLAIVACLASCAAQPIERPFVPALRYASNPAERTPSEDAPYRVAPPIPTSQASLPRAPIASFTLDNGVRVLVVERRRFPTIAVRIVIDAATAFAGDVGGHRAELLGSVYLSPPGRVQRAAGSCGPDGCTVASVGVAGELDDVLARAADLVMHANEAQDVYGKRLEAAEKLLSGSRRPFPRISRALAFGNQHRYGESSEGTRPTLSEIQDLRQRSFVPGAATLIVVGDVPLDTAKAEAKQRLGEWVGERPLDSKPDPPPASANPLRIVAFPGGTMQLWGALVARGPSPRASSAAAFEVLVESLGGDPSAVAFTQAREGMAAAYLVGAFIQWHKEGSMMTLAGSFERGLGIDGMDRLLQAIRGACASEPSVESLDRARRAAVAGWRQEMATNAGMAGLLGDAILTGLSPESTLDFPSRIAAVTAAEVLGAARDFLARSKLRVVFVGDPEFLVNANALGFGWPTRTDGFGVPVPWNVQQ